MGQYEKVESEYSRRIRISSKKLRPGMKSDSPSTNLEPERKWVDFLRETREALDAIRALPTGRLLLAAIDASPHTVTICVAAIDDSGTAPHQDWHKHERRENVTRSDEPNHTVYVFDLDTELTSVLTRADAMLLRTGHEQSRPRVAEMVKSCFWGLEWANKEKPWAAGWKAMWADDSRKGCLVYAFEDYLTPGRGSATTVTWHPRSRNFQKEMERRQLDAKAGGKPLPPGDLAFVDDRPMWAALAHELIHAWRNVSGRTCFGKSRDPDENMTVGLPMPSLELQHYDTECRLLRPATLLSEQLTENRILADAGKPLRAFY